MSSVAVCWSVALAATHPADRSGQPPGEFRCGTASHGPRRGALSPRGQILPAAARSRAHGHAFSIRGCPAAWASDLRGAWEGVAGTAGFAIFPPFFSCRVFSLATSAAGSASASAPLFSISERYLRTASTISRSASVISGSRVRSPSRSSDSRLSPACVKGLKLCKAEKSACSLDRVCCSKDALQQIRIAGFLLEFHKILV